MAIDHALLESVQRGESAVLRFYMWRPACLSLGRNQPAAVTFDRARAETLGIDVVRRPTGGLAVLHDGELTYAVGAPIAIFGGPRAAYQRINAALVAGLRALGVPAQLALGDARGRFGSVPPCFAQAAPGEVVVAGRKLVGSAQRYEGRCILQHGSLLLQGTQRVVEQLTRTSSGADAAISLQEIMGTLPPVYELIDKLTAAFAQVCGICLAPADLTDCEEARTVQLTDLYRSEAWTWRR